MQLRPWYPSEHVQIPSAHEPWPEQACKPPNPQRSHLLVLQGTVLDGGLPVHLSELTVTPSEPPQVTERDLNPPPHVLLQRPSTPMTQPYTRHKRLLQLRDSSALVCVHKLSLCASSFVALLMHETERTFVPATPSMPVQVFEQVPQALRAH